MICLVAGISSSGKFTYLGSTPGEPLLFASALEPRPVLPDNCRLHYNTLRFARNRVKNLDNDFRADTVLDCLLLSGRPFTVDYIFCERDELLRRAASRVHIEGEQGEYPAARIVSCIEALDLSAFHQSWLQLFSVAGAPIRLLWSTNGQFIEVDQLSPVDGAACHLGAGLTDVIGGQRGRSRLQRPPCAARRLKSPRHGPPDRNLT